MATIALPVTEVRNNFLNLMRKAQDVFERVIITKKGKPEAVLMSYDEYEGWLETLDIMSDPDLAKSINAAKEDIKNGRIRTYEEVFGKPQRGMKKQRRKR